MKKIIQSLLLLFAISFITIINSNAKISNYSQAILSFNELNFDFGKVKEGETLEHLFKFTNTGTENLVIQSVQPACGCTAATLGIKKEFAPGETGEIKITFNTQGREGLISKTISVTSNDKNEPVKVLYFNCEIIN